MEIAKILICTKDLNGNEIWTNPPTKNINEVWEFIKGMFNKYIKSFKFYGEDNIYFNPYFSQYH